MAEHRSPLGPRIAAGPNGSPTGGGYRWGGDPDWRPELVDLGPEEPALPRCGYPCVGIRGNAYECSVKPKKGEERCGLHR